MIEPSRFAVTCRFAPPTQRQANPRRPCPQRPFFPSLFGPATTRALSTLRDFPIHAMPSPSRATTLSNQTPRDYPTPVGTMPCDPFSRFSPSPAIATRQAWFAPSQRDTTQQYGTIRIRFDRPPQPSASPCDEPGPAAPICRPFRTAPQRQADPALSDPKRLSLLRRSLIPPGQRPATILPTPSLL